MSTPPLAQGLELTFGNWWLTNQVISVKQQSKSDKNGQLAVVGVIIREYVISTQYGGKQHDYLSAICADLQLTQKLRCKQCQFPARHFQGM